MSRPSTFALEREQDVSGVSGTGTVAHGVRWVDGAVTIRWLGERASTVCWACLDDAVAVHSHGGATRFVWHPETDSLHEWECPKCGSTTRARMADANEVDPEPWGASYLHSALERAHSALIGARLHLVDADSLKDSVKELEDAIDSASTALAMTWRHGIKTVT